MESRARLTEALLRADAADLEARVARIEWMADHVVVAGAIMGPADTLTTLEEARVCFINGHFIATLVLCCAFVDQVIADELQERGFRNVTSDLQKCRDEELFSNALIDDIERLRRIRRGYVHRLSDSHENRLHNRVRSQKCHPRRIMEADGELAIRCMYAFHRATLR